jgi:diacylglycerol kinase (ATP)
LGSRAARWLAIVNPASGRSRARTRWPEYEQALRSRGAAFDTVETARAHDGEHIAKQALLAGRRHLLVAGGDGSLHDVVNGVMGAGLPADDVVTIALTPLGTGNDWARGLKLPRTPAGVAAMLAAGATRRHDVAVIDFPRSAGSEVPRRWFVNVAGAGFDAFVLEHLPQPVRSNVAYFAGMLRGLLAYEPVRFTLTATERGFHLDQALLVAFVAIGRYCGGGMFVAPGAQIDDGLLDVVAIRHPGLLGTLRRLPKLYDGRLLGDRAVTHVQTDRVLVTTKTALSVEADGQIVGQTPFEAGVCPRAINVIVPPGS